MSAATRSARSLSLPDVERNHQPGIYGDLIAAARGRDQEYSKIWDLFAFRQEFGYYNCWITATGVPAMSADSHRTQGRMLASRGYIRN